MAVVLNLEGRPMIRRALLLSLCTLLACDVKTRVVPVSDAGTPLPKATCVDNDGDGVAGTGDCDVKASAFDCDDTDPRVKPGATERCNGIDDNCDGKIDEGLAQVAFYADLDGDGFGSTKVGLGCGEAPKGQTTKPGDCDDSNKNAHPGQTETCNGIDDDCDGVVDNGLGARDYFIDADGDGYGDDNQPRITSCQPVKGYVLTVGDCDDSKPQVRPGATEVCNQVDDNCDGQVDNGLSMASYYPDADGDGFGAAGAAAEVSCAARPGKVTNNTDCNDGNPAIKPGVAEACNGVDDNCNGTVDEGLPLSTYYADADGDGFGDASKPSKACALVAGKVTNKTDCNDSNPAIKPGATEVCNGVDDNCNGSVDDGLTFTNYYLDGDGDGYGLSTGTAVSSCAPVTGRAANKTDCDDTKAAVHPGATEVCNGLDDDCAGGIDNGLPTASYYVDADNDGHGKANSTPTVSCAQPTGFVPSADDCNDAVASVHPGATELCNSVDDDCNGSVDDGLATASYYVDVDADGFGAAGSTAIVSCNVVSGRVTNNADCNDGNPAIKPGATEVCNQVDDNCNGSTDEGLSTLAYYPDADSDGFGSSSAAAQNSCGPVAGKVTNNSDCNDSNPAVKPGATEVCNQVDDNCDGSVDEGLSTQNYYTDADADGFGSSSASAQVSCGPVAGKVTNNTDCNDANPAVKPGATEVCNGVDDNCDSQTDEGLPTQAYYTDGDNDGYGTGASVQRCGPIAGKVTNNTDCNDANGAVHPGATEVCNNVDDNCDAQTDEGNPGGGVACTTGQKGVCAAGTSACTSGAVVCNRDQNPSTELCNSLDDNCDGNTDEGFVGLGNACTAGVGVCLRSGTIVCNSTGSATACSVSPGPTTAPACDGLDNDCDGLVDEPVLTSTVNVTTTAWADIEVKPFYYTAGSCAGGVNGSGTDALAGGAMVMAGPTGGISLQPLTATGIPTGSPSQVTGQATSEVDFAQAGDGYVVAGVSNGTQIDLYYVDSSGGVRTSKVGGIKWPLGCTTNCRPVDSLRMVRGLGRRVIAVWREVGYGLNFAVLEACPVGGSWDVRLAGCANSLIDNWYIQSGSGIQAGIGVDSAMDDWAPTQTCIDSHNWVIPVGVSYLTSTQMLRYFSVYEDGYYADSPFNAVGTSGTATLTAPEMTFFRDGSGTGQFAVSFISKFPDTNITDLAFWLTNDQSVVRHAWAFGANQNGINSIERVRSSSSATGFALTALRYVGDPTSFKRQVMTRQFNTLGAPTPASSSVEIPVTSGSCGTAPDCRPGDKAAFTNWWPFGRVYYSAAGSSPSGSYESVLTCN